jgi:hypothetical protein
LIKTIENNGNDTLYWTGLKLFNNETNSYNFSDGTNAAFATELVKTVNDSKGECVVATMQELSKIFALFTTSIFYLQDYHK